MMNGGKLPPRSPLRDFMYSSAEPTLVWKFLSPRVLYRTVVSDSDGRKKEEKKYLPCQPRRQPLVETYADVHGRTKDKN